jgi:hypothetical protein
MPKGLRWTKSVLYVTAAVLIFIFHKTVMPYVAFLVGGVVMVYALDELAYLIAQKRFADVAESEIQIVLAVLLFLAHGDIVKVCIIWGVWSVIREGREMTHAFVHLKSHRLALVNVAESVVVIVLSCTMILEPGDHHAHVHVILLGIELILEIAFPLLESGIGRLLDRRKKDGAGDPPPPEE